MLLAFALGSLPRGQPGGSILYNSWWILVFISLMPLVGLGLLIGLVIFLAYNSRLFSDALGYGIARKRGMPKKKGRIFEYIIAIAAWAIALEVLTGRRGGLFGTSQDVAQNGTIAQDVTGNQNVTSIPIIQSVSQFTGFVQSSWFYFAFFGLLVVSSVIAVRGMVLSWKESKGELGKIQLIVRPEAVASVEDAYRILKAQPDADPRTRIINCYQRMVQTAQQLGASVTSDQTARELEAALHSMLNIKGPSLDELTNLFEEARYSIHAITEDDAGIAEQCLLSIAQEMNITLSA